jgi:hypothetical protein
MASRFTIVGLSLLILLLSQSPGFADDGPAAGHIVEVEGDVRVLRSNLPDGTRLDWINVTFGMPVYTGDRIKTANDGHLVVEYGNRGLTHIMPGSIFTIRSSSPHIDDNRHWRQLTEDLGVMLSTSDSGVTRGRLYVLIDDKWTAVALESPEEFLPDVLPLGR